MEPNKNQKDLEAGGGDAMGNNLWDMKWSQYWDVRRSGSGRTPLQFSGPLCNWQRGSQARVRYTTLGSREQGPYTLRDSIVLGT